jgi:hypothetical protein
MSIVQTVASLELPPQYVSQQIQSCQSGPIKSLEHSSVLEHFIRIGPRHRMTVGKRLVHAFCDQSETGH